MTIPQTQPLPSNFNIGGYRITMLAESGQDYHLYQAISPDGTSILIREFYPQGIVTRNLSNGELSIIPGNETSFAQAQANFETQYVPQAEGKLKGLGTVFYLYPTAQGQQGQQGQQEQVPHAQPLRPAPQQVPHAQALRPTPAQQPARLRKPAASPLNPVTLPRTKKKTSGGSAITLIIIGMLALLGFLGYQILKDKDEPVAKPVTTPVTQPKPSPQKEQEAEPEPEIAEPEPEPEIAEPEPEPEEEEPDTPEPTEPDLSTSPDVISMEQALREEAIAAKGKFSIKLLNKYPNYAEAFVRDYVKKRGGSFSPAFEKWLKTTKLQREVFAMFYPPDPSVATNAAIIVDEVGEETAEKYNQLVVAFAIGRREFGMGAFDLTHQGRYVDGMHKLEALRSSGTMPSPAELYCAGKPPINWYGNAPGTVDEESYKKVEAYLDQKKMTTKQAWLKKYNTVSSIADPGVTEDNIASFLHEYMYRHNQLRRKRDPFPTPVEFFSYLVDKYENCTKLRDVDRKRVEWTGLSLEGTPWPAMMALSETRPLRECDSVWERLMGQRGPRRIWLYGPYRSDDDKEPPILFSFDPDPEWARDSNERKLYEGGVCGTMSLIARTSLIARGVPAIPAGQPGHGNLMSMHYTGNGCWLTVDQSVDTLKATTGFWYLRDSQASRTGNGEYHYGLALSVNVDYEKFIESRFAMNVYKLAGSSTVADATATPLPKEFTQTAMRTILKSNPFYTEAWYTLFQQEPQDLLNATKMIDEVRATLPEGIGIRKLWKTRKYVSSVSRGDKNDKETLANHSKEYVNVLCSAILENALKGDNQYKTFQWTELLNWLKSESNRNNYPEPKAAYQIAYANAQGTDKLRRTVDKGFKKALNYYRDEKNTLVEPKEIDQQDMSFSLEALCQTLPRQEVLKLMKELLDTCPDGFKYMPKNKNETKIHPFYETLSERYIAMAEDSEKERIKADKEKASQKILELSKSKEGEGNSSTGRRRRR